MPNTNAQAIEFAKTRIRPMADLLYTTYLSAKSLIAQWNAQQVSTVIPNDAVIIGDGSDVSGNPQMTDAMATNIVTRCIDFVTDYENGSNAKLNTVADIQVNGKGIF